MANDDAQLAAVLNDVRRIAMAGLSGRFGSPGHMVAVYLVVVIRRPQHVHDVARDVIEASPKYLWLQLGIRNDGGGDCREPGGEGLPAHLYQTDPPETGEGQYPVSIGRCAIRLQELASYWFIRIQPRGDTR